MKQLEVKTTGSDKWKMVFSIENSVTKFYLDFSSFLVNGMSEISDIRIVEQKTNRQKVAEILDQNYGNPDTKADQRVISEILETLGVKE